MQPGHSKSKTTIIKELSNALAHLYDPDVLWCSRLMQVFHIPNEEDAVEKLRRILIEGIKALEPNINIPVDSNMARYYKILYYRFVEQSAQKVVAIDLGISQRHLRRQEAKAVEILADYFRAKFHIEDQDESDDFPLPSKASTLLREKKQRWREDLTSLGDNEGLNPIDICETIQKVLITIAPCLEESGTRVDCLLDETSLFFGKEMALRQALLHLLMLNIQAVPGGKIEVSANFLPKIQVMCIRIGTKRADDALPTVVRINREDQELAQELVRLAGGTLELKIMNGKSCPLSTLLTLHGLNSSPVLVVDDNPDTLRLFQLYLRGTHYRYIGTSDPGEGLPLAIKLSPVAIILDIMMPGMDGWELLGSLREHPDTKNIPIIVCSILPHEHLASVLGAKHFLKKPVERAELIKILDQEVSKPPIESRTEL